MKKTLIALAAVAVSTGAMAQAHNQATISGTINATVDSQKGTKNAIGFNDTNLRFAVSEDLGGGLTASGFFTLDGLNARGAVPAASDSGLSVAGAFGTVAIANTRSSNVAIGAGLFGTYLKTTSWDSSGSAVAGRTAGTAVSYTSPELAPGLRVNAGVFLVSKLTLAVSPATQPDAAQVAASEDQQARVNIIGVTYAQGPMTAAVAFKGANDKARIAAGGTKASATEAHVTYNLGVARVGVGYATATTTGGKHLMVLGVNAPVTSNITVGFNYGKRDKAKYQELGATYALSKRTAVTLHTGTFNKQATPATKTTQSRVALRHSF